MKNHLHKRHTGAVQTYQPLVPVCLLGEQHRARIAAHLQALNQRDRYLRFGFAADDAMIERYVNGMNFVKDEIFGIYNRHLKLIATAHLAYSADQPFSVAAEFGVSVLASARGRGYGARLFERAATHARNQGVSKLFIHVLSENTAMLKIAQRAGAIVEHDGAESQAHLSLPAATLSSHLSEMFDEQMAQANYRFKWQAKHFADSLSAWQSPWRSSDQVGI